MNDDYDNAQTDKEMSERYVDWRQRGHSATPWQHSNMDDGDGFWIWSTVAAEGREAPVKGFGVLGVANCYERADARRVVACVNACRDLSTEALEKLVADGRELELALTLSQMEMEEP